MPIYGVSSSQASISRRLFIAPRRAGSDDGVKLITVNTAPAPRTTLIALIETRILIWKQFAWTPAERLAREPDTRRSSDPLGGGRA